MSRLPWEARETDELELVRAQRFGLVLDGLQEEGFGFRQLRGIQVRQFRLIQLLSYLRTKLVQSFEMVHSRVVPIRPIDLDRVTANDLNVVGSDVGLDPAAGDDPFAR